MEHSNLRTLHYDDVPRSLAREVTQLADLTYTFGPQGEGFFHQHLENVAAKKLGLDLPDARLAPLTEATLEEQILNEAATRGSHVLLVLQIHPNVMEGYVCLVSRDTLDQVTHVLEQVSGRLR